MLDLEMTPATAAGMISLFAIGTMIGRLLSGFTLDRFPSQVIAALILGSPGVGLLVLGSGPIDTSVIAFAVFLIGFATGAELDIVAYLVMRFFPVEIYGTAFGMVAAAIALSSAAGSAFLGALLSATGSFSPFLLVTAVTTIGGANLFLLLKPGRQHAADTPTTQSA
jgi:MFS family permease